MPELPEVETIRRGIAGLVERQVIAAAVVREGRLRWPVPAHLPQTLAGQTVLSVGRRAKYLLLGTGGGTLLIHLGMSGSLRWVDGALPAAKHDHVDLLFANGRALRLNDPRRFGAVLWTAEAADRHPLLAGLGPEPLADGFDGGHLHASARRRRLPVKALLMDSRVVAGVGNIYANEALFEAAIAPARPADALALADCHLLVAAIRRVLRQAIAEGGTTLRDFADADGRPGYFQQRLRVYGRGGLACPRCGQGLALARLQGRATVFCPGCQR